MEEDIPEYEGLNFEERVFAAKKYKKLKTKSEEVIARYAKHITYLEEKTDSQKLRICRASLRRIEGEIVNKWMNNLKGSSLESLADRLLGHFQNHERKGSSYYESIAAGVFFANLLGDDHCMKEVFPRLEHLKKGEIVGSVQKKIMGLISLYKSPN